MNTTRIAFIVVVEDYHDIEMIADCIQGVKLSTIELGMSGQDYVGFIFSHQSPSDNEIHNFLVAAKIQLNNDYESP